MIINNNEIHILFGETATGLFKLAYQTVEYVLTQRDYLSYGSILNCSSLQEWKKVRANHMKNIFEDQEFNIFGDKSDLLYNPKRLNDFDTIYVWAGIDLEEQLLILFVVYLVDLVGGNPERIKLIQYETFPDELMPMYAMGYLYPEQMLAHPEPIPLTKKHITLYRNIWIALTSTNPAQLVEIIASPEPLIKYTTAALHFMLRRYPRIETGLDYWDYQLLINSDKTNNVAAKILSITLGRSLEGDSVHSDFLFIKLRKLASSNNIEPLLKLSGKQTSYRDTYISITAFGRAVLNGKKSSYPTNPIDTWIGGVHLSSITGNLLFFDNGKLIKQN